MVLRFDPFREIDRLAEQAFAVAGGRVPRAMPMDLYRSGDHYVVLCDLAGVDPGSIDVSVDGSVMTVKAQRSSRTEEGVQWLAQERPTGTFQRQLTLGDGLDATGIAATYADGVLTVTIPVAERAKPRRIPISGHSETKVIEGTSSQQATQG